MSVKNTTRTTTADISKRCHDHRIFVNRNMYLQKIKFYGFDMDYTLAEYKSPFIEELILKYAVELLLEEGYPEELKKIEYDPEFSARGLVFDTLYGNFLKIDPYGHILLAVHGFQFLDRDVINVSYPSRFITVSNTKRFVIFNTLFELPEMFLISCVIDLFEKSPNWQRKTDHLVEGVHTLYYSNIYNDVNVAIGKAHCSGNLKSEISTNISKFLDKKVELPVLLNRLRKFGKKTFIATNSEYWFTDNIMTYLFDFKPDELDAGMSTNWRDYFDIIIVGARKPLFFAEGSKLCKINLKTGKPTLGVFTGRLEQGAVYNGGSSKVVAEMLGSNGNDILYVGDHIFGDILKSKKNQGWRTFLVVPELRKEIDIWRTKGIYFDTITECEANLASRFLKLDMASTQEIEINDLTTKITKAVSQLESCYGALGSLLRCGARPTFFASQLSRFADLYSHSCINLLHYPLNYFFRSPAILMPHESTVDHQSYLLETADISGDICEEVLDEKLTYRNPKSTIKRSQTYILDENYECL